MKGGLSLEVLIRDSVPHNLNSGTPQHITDAEVHLIIKISWSSETPGIEAMALSSEWGNLVVRQLVGILVIDLNEIDEHLQTTGDDRPLSLGLVESEVDGARTRWMIQLRFPSAD